ncbi:MAG: dihydrofolate reductase family protein [Actinomycetota bacterium]|nr:dihydrofolate reductase family protein [Actinomycetota bacterium]
MSNEPVTFRRLFPESAEVSVEDLLGSLDLGARASGRRPYTFVNFVASADGRASYAGRSGALGDDGDHAMFHGLRESADAVMAGTVTLSTESYGRILGTAERRARRAARGQSPEPLAVVITRSGEVPTEIPLFAEPEARIVIFTASALRLGSAAAQVEVVALDPSELTLTTALRRLRADFGVRTLLCEGGPTLFGALVRETLVDELFLTLAPKLVGGGNGPAVTSGAELPELQPLRIEWLLERHGSLYVRYALAARGAEQ